MTDVNESLQELVERRLREMGQRRGRGENLSLREAWMRLPEQDGGSRAVSYETVRRIRELGHNKIGDATADALATMLEVPVDEVLAAAGQRKRLGPFQMPRRADRLTESERAAVLGVVDAILEAGQSSATTEVEGRPVRRTPSRRQLIETWRRAVDTGAMTQGELDRRVAELDEPKRDAGRQVG